MYIVNTSSERKAKLLPSPWVVLDIMYEKALQCCSYSLKQKFYSSSIILKNLPDSNKRYILISVLLIIAKKMEIKSTMVGFKLHSTLLEYKIHIAEIMECHRERSGHSTK